MENERTSVNDLYSLGSSPAVTQHAKECGKNSFEDGCKFSGNTRNDVYISHKPSNSLEITLNGNEEMLKSSKNFLDSGTAKLSVESKMDFQDREAAISSCGLFGEFQKRQQSCSNSIPQKDRSIEIVDDLEDVHSNNSAPSFLEGVIEKNEEADYTNDLEEGELSNTSLTQKESSIPVCPFVSRELCTPEQSFGLMHQNANDKSNYHMLSAAQTPQSLKSMPVLHEEFSSLAYCPEFQVSREIHSTPSSQRKLLENPSEWEKELRDLKELITECSRKKRESSSGKRRRSSRNSENCGTGSSPYKKTFCSPHRITNSSDVSGRSRHKRGKTHGPNDYSNFKTGMRDVHEKHKKTLRTTTSMRHCGIASHSDANKCSSDRLSKIRTSGNRDHCQHIWRNMKSPNNTAKNVFRYKSCDTFSSDSHTESSKRSNERKLSSEEVVFPPLKAVVSALNYSKQPSISGWPSTGNSTTHHRNSQFPSGYYDRSASETKGSVYHNDSAERKLWKGSCRDDLLSALEGHDIKKRNTKSKPESKLRFPPTAFPSASIVDFTVLRGLKSEPSTKRNVSKHLTCLKRYNSQTVPFGQTKSCSTQMAQRNRSSSSSSHSSTKSQMSSEIGRHRMSSSSSLSRSRSLSSSESTVLDGSKRIVLSRGRGHENKIKRLQTSKTKLKSCDTQSLRNRYKMKGFLRNSGRFKENTSKATLKGANIATSSKYKRPVATSVLEADYRGLDENLRKSYRKNSAGLVFPNKSSVVTKREGKIDESSSGERQRLCGPARKLNCSSSELARRGSMLLSLIEEAIALRNDKFIRLMQAVEFSIARKRR